MVEADDSTLRIALLWHSERAANLGVQALTSSHIKLVTDAAASIGATATFVIIGWVEGAGPRRDGPEVVELRLVDFLPIVGRLYRTIRQSDVVLDISAGDSFTDIYGTHRALTQLASKLMVLLARRPLVLAPQTIGPFERRSYRRLARQILQRAAGVFTRDAASLDYARQIGVTADIVQATDVAMALPYELPTRSAGPRRIGLNVSGLLVHGGYSRHNMFGLQFDYRTLIESVIEHLLTEPDTEIHLVPHVCPPDNVIEDDYAASRELADRYPGLIVHAPFADASSAKSFIAGLDAFIGSRMHACIAALSAGVPVLPIAYSRKFAGLFGTLGYPHLIDGQRADHEQAMGSVRAFLGSLAHVQRDVDAARCRAVEYLDVYRDVLAERVLAPRAQRRREHRRG